MEKERERLSTAGEIRRILRLARVCFLSDDYKSCQGFITFQSIELVP